jgi:hypothetical protein
MYHFSMADSPDNKARRRRRLRQTIPAPLDQVAIRHVDAIQALNGNQRALLAKAIAQTGIANVSKFLVAIKNSDGSIQSETNLISLLDLVETHKLEAVEDPAGAKAQNWYVEAVDMDYLTGLLLKCYPDMPQATADLLAGTDVLAPSLQVVATTRLTLRDAKSDFVITTLYTLFEQKLDETEKIIARNPSFIKAMQLSRPDWKPD